MRGGAAAQRGAFLAVAVLIVASSLIASTPAAASVDVPLCFGHKATIVGTAAADSITATTGPDVIVTLGGDDFVGGGQGNDLICTGTGSDSVRAGQGNDRIDGGAGRDSIYGNTGADHLQGGPGGDWLNGGADRDALYGGGGDDEVTGANRDDKLYGQRGNDRLVPNSQYGSSPEDGDDLVDGGPGQDIVVLALSAPSPSGVTVDLPNGTATAVGTAILVGIEGADVDSLGNDNTLIGDVNDNTFMSRGATEIFGGGGDDTYFPDDEVPHADPNDGAQPSDIFHGGAGSDTINFGNLRFGFQVSVDLSEGTAHFAHDMIFDSVENVVGSDNDDTISGDDGPNALTGGAGADVIDGRGGSDVCSGEQVTNCEA